MHSLESIRQMRNLELIGIGQNDRLFGDDDGDTEELPAWAADPMRDSWTVWERRSGDKIYHPRPMTDPECFDMKLEQSQACPASAITRPRKLFLTGTSAPAPPH